MLQTSNSLLMVLMMSSRGYLRLRHLFHPKLCCAGRWICKSCSTQIKQIRRYCLRNNLRELHQILIKGLVAIVVYIVPDVRTGIVPHGMK